ncbi:hypothetical protein AB0J51_20945 [Micromonospora echinofusca]
MVTIAGNLVSGRVTYGLGVGFRIAALPAPTLPTKRRPEPAPATRHLGDLPDAGPGLGSVAGTPQPVATGVDQAVLRADGEWTTVTVPSPDSYRVAN